MAKRQELLSICTYLVPDFPIEYFETITQILEDELHIFTTLQVESRWFGPPVDRQDPLTHADLVFMSPASYIGYTQGSLRGLVTPGTNGMLLPVCAVHTTPGVSPSGTTDQYASIIVHKNSLAKEFLDLRGCRWAYGPPSHAAAHQLTLLNMKKMGEGSNFFASKVRAGCDREALNLILDKRIDAAAVDAHAFYLFTKQNPLLAPELKVLTTWGPLAPYPIIARQDMNQDLRQEVTAALFRINANPRHRKLLAQFGVSGFRENGSKPYRELAEKMEIASHLSFDATYY